MSLRSRSARHKPIWIPQLAMNDDPGFAATFSSGDLQKLVLFALDRFSAAGHALPEDFDAGPLIESLPSEIRQFAKTQKKLSPSRIEMLMARALSPRAAGRMHADEVFADLTGAADFPAFLYLKLAGEDLTPRDLDARLDQGDTLALVCLFIQAEFIGRVLALMQKERVDNELAPAYRVYGSGSGFNSCNAEILGPAIVRAMSAHVHNFGLARDQAQMPETADLLVYSDGPTTLACYGAAVGAARGIIQH